MAEGLGRERWAHTSMICCLIANANRDPRRSRPFKPSDFDPYTARRSEAVVVDKENIGLLRQAFTQVKESK